MLKNISDKISWLIAKNFTTMLQLPSSWRFLHTVNTKYVTLFSYVFGIDSHRWFLAILSQLGLAFEIFISLIRKNTNFPQSK